MVTKNGPNVSFGPTSARLVLEAAYSPSNVTSSTSSVTVSWSMKIMLTAPGSANDTGTYSITGDDSASGSRAWNLSGQGDTYTIVSGTDTVSLNYGSGQTWNLSGSLNNPVLADLSVSGLKLTIPARPYVAPDPQSGLSATWVNDGQINLSWTRNATTAGPYEGQEVWRSADGGSYVRIAFTLSGSVDSWSDTSAEPNKRYLYRLKAVNSAGTSDYSGADGVSTTPATPAAPTATKLANGDIRITAPPLSYVTTDWRVYDSEDGGAFLLVSPDIPKGTSSWVHPVPDPTKTHTYRIDALSTDPVLASAASPPSETVQLLTAPAAPTNLSPNGAVRDMTDATPLSWDHNSIDSSEQTAFQIRRRRAGGAWTTDAKVTSTTEGTSWPANHYANGGADIEWEVSTWGAATTGGRDGTGASPWSPTATIQPYAQPVAGTVDPVGTGSVTLPSHLFQFSFFQEQGLTQSQWVTEVYDGIQIIASGSGSGTALTWQSPAVFVDGGSYSWRARVRDSKGVWSGWTPKQTFTAEFVPPNDPTATIKWYRDGYVRLNLEAINDGIAPDTVSMRVERSIDGGPWVLLVEDLDPSTEYLDWTATVAGENCYRVIAVSQAGATSSITECITVGGADCDHDVYIGGGSDLGMVVRFGLAEAPSITTGRQRVLNEFDGRSDPVETSGPSVPYSISVKAKIPPPVECGDLGVSDPLLIERVFHMPGPHLYRDWRGRHMFVSLSDLQYDDDYLGGVSFSVRRADGGTEAQRSAIGAYVGPYMTESPDGVYRIVGGTLVESSPGEWVWTP